MSSESVKLGESPPEHAGRDAVHVAVVPMTARCPLMPGERVDQHGWPAHGLNPLPAVGLVDPFRPPDLIRPGERFWLCLFPGTITGLRHVWTHPAFSPKPPEARS